MKINIRKFVLSFLMMVLVLSGCSPLVAGTPTATSQAPLASPSNSTPAAGVYPPPFASYSEVAAKIPQTFQGGGYSLPVDLGKVQGLDQIDLTDSQRGLLAQNGFVVDVPTPGQYNEFYQVYEQERYDQMPVFVTTDSSDCFKIGKLHMKRQAIRTPAKKWAQVTKVAKFNPSAR